MYQGSSHNLDNQSLNFHGAIYVIDQVMSKLFKTAEKLKRETIFIFTSDNGGSLVKLKNRSNGHGGGCNWPYKGKS